MKKIRYGIIGVGNQGGFYARYLTGGMAMMGAVPTNAELGALCDIDPAKRTMCEIMYPEKPFFTDYKEMIASGTVDAIVTTVPHYLAYRNRDVRDRARYASDRGKACGRVRQGRARDERVCRKAPRGVLRHYVQPAHQ